MDKRILYDYVDACALIKETEEDIRKHRKNFIVQDKVKGSNPEFPYQEQSFTVCGCVEDECTDDEELLLKKRRDQAESLKLQVEQWMLTIPMRMQRIIRFRYFMRMGWDETAVEMGGKATADSVKMELRRFLEKL